jgi:hypothetical protein
MCGLQRVSSLDGLGASIALLDFHGTFRDIYPYIISLEMLRARQFAFTMEVEVGRKTQGDVRENGAKGVALRVY